MGEGAATAGGAAGAPPAPGPAPELPVVAVKRRLLKALKKHPTVVLVSETGSGKTTQLPTLILKSGLLGPQGRVLVTQPRKVAAVSVATHVAKSLRVPLGREVGYAVRFDNRTSALTRLLYVTDGILLQMLLSDRHLLQYDMVILDEAHERSLNTDTVMGLCKAIQRHRAARAAEGGGVRPLRLVVMSATLEVQRFAAYFNAPAFFVCGRQHHVDTFYTVEPGDNYVHLAYHTVLQVHGGAEAGDVLVFMAGQEDILMLQDLLLLYQAAFQGEGREDFVVCCLYAALSLDAQIKAFQRTPRGKRKVVLATNIAETSITIPGIRFVVDTGFTKFQKYDAASGATCLTLASVSQAQATQRAGRAGRDGPGTCYRLYTEEVFLGMPAALDPAITHSSLEQLILRLKALGVPHVQDFDFLTAPAAANVAHALEHLHVLGALHRDGSLTEALGRVMVHLPLEPWLSKCLVTAHRLGCVEAVAGIVALLSVDNLSAKLKYHASLEATLNPKEGDLLMLGQVYAQYLAQEPKRRDPWCKANGLKPHVMKHAHKVAGQLQQILQKHEGQLARLPGGGAGEALGDPVKESLVSGLFYNAASQARIGRYHVLRTGTEVRLQLRMQKHLAKASHVVFAELAYPGTYYARYVMPTDEATVNRYLHAGRVAVS